MNTWRSTYGSFVPSPALDAWLDAHRARLADEFLATFTPDPRDWKGTKRASGLEKAVAPVNEWQIHAEGVRAFRAIVAAQRARQDRATDRLLAKRTDALGQLFARAPRSGRTATAA